MVPGLVTILVFFTAYVINDTGNLMLFIFLCQQFFTACSMFWLAFGPWKRWRCGPGCAYVLTILIYLVLPFLQWFLILAFIQIISTSTYGGWLLTSASLSATNIV